MFPRITFSILFLAILVSTAIASDAPAWMKQAMTASIPSYEKDVPAVVLRDEEQVTVGDDGKIVTTQNYAIKMLTREGRGMAIARGLYLVSSGKVRDIEAWLIRPDGTTKTYDKKSVLDIISDPDDVYNEYRIKVIDASVDSDTGAVFGYTIVSEESALFYQDSWKFQSRLPTVFSRYSLTLRLDGKPQVLHSMLSK